MKELTENISPTVHDVVDKISNVINDTIKQLENKLLCDTSRSEIPVILTSHVLGTNIDDAYSCSISFALSTDSNNEKTLNFFIVQNTKNADICIIISTGERDGTRILFKSINKYPIIGIEKYLPNIIASTIKILE